MSEKAYRQKIEKALRAEGFFVYTPNDQRTGGVPDVLACRFVFFAVEVKTTKAQDTVVKLNHPLSAQQSNMLRSIAGSGGVAVVATGCDGMIGVTRARELAIGPSSELDIEEWLCMEELATWLKNISDHSRLETVG